MNNSESARKLNQAVNNTGRAVGEALSQAKGAFSSLWSTFTAQPTNTEPAPVENPQVTIVTTDTDSNEVAEAREGMIKQLAKKFHNSDLSLRPEKDAASNPSGIVEIGREADTLDTNRSNKIIDA